MDSELMEELAARREVSRSLRTVRRRLVLEVKAGVRSLGEANREFTFQLIEADRHNDPTMRVISEWEVVDKVGTKAWHRAQRRSSVEAAHDLQVSEIVANGREVSASQLLEWQAAQMEAQNEVRRELQRRGPRSVALLPEQLVDVARSMGW